MTMTPRNNPIYPIDLQIRQFNLDGVHVMQLSGESDVASRETLLEAIARAHEANRPVIVDASQLTFCDAQCAGPLLAASQKTELALVAPTRIVALVFDLLDPTEELARHPTVDAAVQALGHARPPAPSRPT